MADDKYREVRVALETELEKRGVPVDGSFQIHGQTYWRSWSSSGDGFWSLEGTTLVLAQLQNPALEEISTTDSGRRRSRRRSEAPAAPPRFRSGDG